MTNEECMEHLRAVINNLAESLQIVPFQEYIEEFTTIPLTFISYPDCPEIRSILKDLNIPVHDVHGGGGHESPSQAQIIYLTTRELTVNAPTLEACSIRLTHSEDVFILNIEEASNLINLAAMVVMQDQDQYAKAAYEIIRQSSNAYCTRYFV